MQFSQLRTRAALRFNDPTFQIVANATSTTLPTWSDYINEAYREVNTETPYWPWREGQTTVTVPAASGAFSDSAALPTDCLTVLAVWDQTNQMPLVPLEGRAQYLNEYPQQSEVGTALHYRVYNNNLYLYPQPQASTTVRIDYRSMPADLVNDTDVPVFPSAYHSMLIEWALAHAYLDDGNLQQYQTHMQVFQGRIESLRNEMLAEPHQDRYPEIVDTFL